MLLFSSTHLASTYIDCAFALLFIHRIAFTDTNGRIAVNAIDIFITEAYMNKTFDSCSQVIAYSYPLNVAALQFRRPGGNYSVAIEILMSFYRVYPPIECAANNLPLGIINECMAGTTRKTAP